jgi:hypothetical protein
MLVISHTARRAGDWGMCATLPDGQQHLIVPLIFHGRKARRKTR